MKKSHWIIFTVVFAFLGFLIGFSVPPFMHAGSAGGENKVESAPKIDKATQDYYKNLLKEEE